MLRLTLCRCAAKRQSIQCNNSAANTDNNNRDECVQHSRRPRSHKLHYSKSQCRIIDSWRSNFPPFPFSSPSFVNKSQISFHTTDRRHNFVNCSTLIMPQLNSAMQQAMRSARTTAQAHDAGLAMSIENRHADDEALISLCTRRCA